MTKQQIKQMMHESKAIEWFNSENMDWLEYVNVFDRFASLVVAAEREQIIALNAPEIERINEYIKTLEEAVAAEREACAKVCEQAGIDGYGTLAAAAMIRARGEK
jgi:hypothetical protein